MDFSKACDKVGHNRLIEKLGISMEWKTNMWKKKFLTDRKQTVVLEGERSYEVTVSSGVPQRSVPGPCLFLFYMYMYINNIPEQLRAKVRLHRRHWRCSQVKMQRRYRKTYRNLVSRSGSLSKVTQVAILTSIIDLTTILCFCACSVIVYIKDLTTIWQISYWKHTAYCHRCSLLHHIFPVFFTFSHGSFAHGTLHNVLKLNQPIKWIVTHDLLPQKWNVKASLIGWGGFIDR